MLSVLQLLFLLVGGQRHVAIRIRYSWGLPELGWGGSLVGGTTKGRDDLEHLALPCILERPVPTQIPPFLLGRNLRVQLVGVLNL